MRTNKEIVSPDEVFKGLAKKLFPTEYRKDTIAVAVSALIAFLLCYSYKMITGLSGPDAIIEGTYMYVGGDNALACGRWFIYFVNVYFARSIIQAPIIVFMYCFTIMLSCIMLGRLFNIRKVGYLVLMTAAMISFHVVSRQFSYLYMAWFYAFSFFMCVSAVCLIRKRKIWSVILATACLLLMVGSYQTYIGAVAALAVIMFIIEIVDGSKKSEAFINLGITTGAGLVACLVDIPLTNILSKVFGQGVSSRVSDSGAMSIFENLGFSFKYAYKWFFIYFSGDDVLSRNVLYIVLISLTVLLLLIAVIKMLISKEIVNAILIVVAVLLLPFTMNISLVLFPHAGLTDIMRYHYSLVFVLLFALLSRNDIKIFLPVAEWIAYVVFFVLISTYAVSANATSICEKLAYDATYTQATAILNKVYDLEDYKPDETKIVLGGIITYMDTYTYYNNLFHYANMEPGPVFWNGSDGAIRNRYGYMLAYLGVNPGVLSVDEYLGVVNSEEFKEMPVWPQTGSVKMINDMAVVKLEENP